MSTDVTREATITYHVGGCLESFRNLTLSLKGADGDFMSQIRLEDVEDEFGRFRIWSGNIGAHRTGRSSLDYRLRDASHIRQRVISLLIDLKELLQEAAAIIHGEKVPWDCLSSDSDSDTERSSAEYVDDEGVSGITRDDFEDTTELKQLHSSIAQTVTLLLRLSIAIRNPTPHDQFIRSTNIDTSFYEEYDIMHVREKFPLAEDYLVTRLGRAISRRRQYLKYREAHQKKLKYGLETTETSIEDSKTEMVPQSTVASSLPAALKDVDYLDLTEDSSSEMGFSEASTSMSDANTMKLRVPPLPEASQGGAPFECPLCFMIISISSARSWKHHVYKDLHPFICTVKHCPTPDRLFEDRNRWFEHEREMHMRFWQCGEGCHETFTSKFCFENHQRREHHKTFIPNQSIAFQNMHERQVDAKMTVECPLCQEKTPFFPQYRRHLGKHQEQLALFAVPSDLYQAKEEAEEDEEDAVDNQIGLDGVESARSESDINSEEGGQKIPPSKVQSKPPDETTEDLVAELSHMTGPTVHQEVITHYRHIDHGFETVPPAPRTVIEKADFPPSPSPLPRTEDSGENQIKAGDNFDATDHGHQDYEDLIEYNTEGEGHNEVHRAANRVDRPDKDSLNIDELETAAYKGKSARREALIDEEDNRRQDDINKLEEKPNEELAQKLLSQRENAEEEEFERRVREKFLNAGYSREYVDVVISKKRRERQENIDLRRPTYIKVNRKYLVPETLDAFGLPWEWDQRDNEFLIIKKYIDHALQDELFAHTRRIKDLGYVASTRTTQEKPGIFRSATKPRPKKEDPAGSESRATRSPFFFT